MSQTASKADEWFGIRPGSEMHVVLALGRLVAERRGLPLPPAFANSDVEAAAATADISVETLEHLAARFADAGRAVAIPGGSALAQSNGLELAEAVLALNALVGALGREGGVYLSPAAPLTSAYHAPASSTEMMAFIEKLNSGRVKTLFVHGTNPVFDLPKSFGFEEALNQVPQVISFATFPDETAVQADYVFPDHHGLESWGYQQVATGANASVLSGAQPVVVPMFNSKSTVDVFLAAAQQAGGKAAAALPFQDEVEFIQKRLEGLLPEAGGFFSAPEINTFTAYFQQHGGWWTLDDKRQAPSTADVLNRSFEAATAEFDGEGEFHLLPFVSPVLGEAGANKPWLQEVPDPTTTVMWNTWIEINPETADELGIQDQDVVRVSSATGSVEATAYRYPAIRPDTIAMPFGQGHTAYGRFAEKRGANPMDLIGTRTNAAGDPALGSMKVRIERTGRKRELARLEGALGVYGFDAK